MKKPLIFCIAVTLMLLAASAGLAEFFEPTEPNFQADLPGNTDFFSSWVIMPGTFYFARQNRDYREMFVPSEDGVYSFYIRNEQKPGSWHTHYGFFDKYESTIQGLPRDIAVEGIAPRIEKFELKADHEYHINLFANETDFYFAICSPSRHAGTLADFEVIQEPTCTERGYKAQRCLLCGGEANRVEIPAAGHVAGDTVTAKAPTCTENGESYVRCAVCGQEMSASIVLSTGHKFGEEQVIREATCLSKGLRGVKCSVCGIVLSEKELPLTDHTLTAWVDLKPVTCTVDGLRVQRCGVCGETLKTEEIPAFGHSPAEWQITRETTCTHSGLREVKCAICGAVMEQEEIPTLDHVYTEWEVTKEPTLDEEGEKTRHCIHCGDTQVETINKILKVMRVVY